MDKIIQIITTKNELKEVLSECISEHQKKVDSERPMKIYTINQVAKKLGMSHSTIKKKINQGLIKATADNRILGSEINNYLKNNC